MSLDWNITKCKINNTKDITDDEWNVLQSVIFTSMYVDMGSITESNWEDFYARTYAWERTAGSALCRFEGDKKIPVYLTPEDIHKWIGLSTNVITTTEAKFKSKIADIMKDNAKGELRSFKKKVNDAEAG